MLTFNFCGIFITVIGILLILILNLFFFFQDGWPQNALKLASVFLSASKSVSGSALGRGLATPGQFVDQVCVSVVLALIIYFNYICLSTVCISNSPRKVKTSGNIQTIAVLNAKESQSTKRIKMQPVKRKKIFDYVYKFFFHLSNRKRFPCLHSLILTREGLGEFETFMQTRDEVDGLHNCREFS